ncbi:aminoacyl-tRNA hydrolase [Oleiharenicola sp. Vm1]|uniref:aminoacyl-tRNA hydrolase n=1 Tax=Oleiharenicola sp. Vm1 TaxID=3398393 RepID=UPI0039F57A07
MSVTLLAGLGNPGAKYAGTRHNLGFKVVDALAAAEGLSWKHEARFEAEIARWNVRPGETRWLIKPQTFMNESGRALRRLLDFHKLPAASLAVAYDEMNIEIGRVKLSVDGSAGGHNGIASLLEHVGNGFLRYRLGIGSSERPVGMDLADYVLGKFSLSEQQLIDQNLKTFVEGARLLFTSSPAEAMNRLNRRTRHEQA